MKKSEALFFVTLILVINTFSLMAQPVEEPPLGLPVFDENQKLPGIVLADRGKFKV